MRLIPYLKVKTKTAYIFIRKDAIDGTMLVDLIEGEWYKVLLKQITAVAEELTAKTVKYLIYSPVIPP